MVLEHKGETIAQEHYPVDKDNQSIWWFVHSFFKDERHTTTVKNQNKPKTTEWTPSFDWKISNKSSVETKEGALKILDKTPLPFVPEGNKTYNAKVAKEV